MVTKEEFGQFIAEFEAFRDMVLEEIGKITNRIENIEDEVKDMKSSLNVPSKKLN
jgi:hypothetical protein